jgi:hypothetical protein
VAMAVIFLQAAAVITHQLVMVDVVATTQTDLNVRCVARLGTPLTCASTCSMKTLFLNRRMLLLPPHLTRWTRIDMLI